MFARLLILFYAIVSYAVFLVSFLYALGFVGNYLVPKSIDVGGPANLSEAIVVDLLLLGILRSFRTVSPFAWRHVEMRTERLVEIRQVVESPPISHFRNVQRLLVRITQRVAAALKPVFEQPVTERLADLPKP